MGAAREEIVLQMDSAVAIHGYPNDTVTRAIRVGDYKLLEGYIGPGDWWPQVSALSGMLICYVWSISPWRWAGSEHHGRGARGPGGRPAAAPAGRLPRAGSLLPRHGDAHDAAVQRARRPAGAVGPGRSDARACR